MVLEDRGGRYFTKTVRVREMEDEPRGDLRLEATKESIPHCLGETPIFLLYLNSVGPARTGHTQCRQKHVHEEHVQRRANTNTYRCIQQPATTWKIRNATKPFPFPRWWRRAPLRERVKDKSGILMADLRAKAILWELARSSSGRESRKRVGPDASDARKMLLDCENHF